MRRRAEALAGAVHWLVAAHDALSARERLIIAVTLGMAIVLAFGQFAISPLVAAFDEARNNIDRQAALVATREGALAELERRAAEDPDAALRLRKAQLERALLLQNKAFEEQLSQLVRPAEMVDVLVEVLGSTGGIAMVSLQNLPVTRIDRPAGEDRGQAAAGAAEEAQGRVEGGLYRHGVRVEFEADYFETVAYLEALERLGNRLIFRSIDYRVVDHPRARVVIVVETLGLDADWLGV